MPDSLAFVEHPNHIDEALRSAGDQAGLVSLSPGVAIELACRGLPFSIPEDDFDVAAYNAAALADYDRLRAWCERLDGVFAEACPPLASAGLTPARWHFYFLKILLDGLTSRAWLLEHTVRRAGARRVHYASTLVDKPGDNLFFRRESIYSLILPLVAAKLGVETAPLFDGRPQSFDVAGRRPSRLQVVTEAARFGPKYLVDSLRQARQRRSGAGAPAGAPALVFLTDRGHDLPDLIRVLLDQRAFSLHVYDYKTGAVKTLLGTNRARPAATEGAGQDGAEIGVETRGELERQATALYAELEGGDWFRSLFLARDIDLFPVAESGLRHFVVTAPAIAWNAYQRARGALAPMSPLAVMTQTTNMGYAGLAAVQAARNEGAALIAYQEGAGFGVPYCPIYDYTDYDNCDYFLSYGEGTAEHLRANGVPVRCEVVPVGSMKLDRLRQQRRVPKVTRRRAIMYVPTYVMGNVQHHPYNGGAGNYYFNLQVAVVRKLATAFPDTTVILKLARSMEQYLPEYLAKCGRGLANIRVIEGIPLAYALDWADVFVIDFPSTTLLECATTDRPIVVYVDEHLTALSAASRQSLSQRARLVGAVEDLPAAVTAALADADGSVASDDYIRRYGTYLDDGRSGERVLAFLTDLAGGRQP